MLDFQKISFDLKPLIDKYFYSYGEGSCQHSFATEFCFNAKYGDVFCVKDDFLYIMRSNFNDEKYRAYLFPMGKYDDLDRVKDAVQNILSDAHENDRKVKFLSITENAKNILEKFYGDKFIIEDKRDLYEYIYKYETLAIMDGSHFKAKRNEIRKFFKTYDNIEIKNIDSKDVLNMKELYKHWVDEEMKRQSNQQLDFEEIALDTALEYYHELGLDGITVYCGNELIGFVFGVKLNEDSFDYMIEKANSEYRGIYKVLNNELAKRCCSNYKYLNFEEDLGEEGLRNSKMMYHPDVMLKKFSATEA